MLNKKFASIRTAANVKTENKRSSVASSIASHHQQQQQSQRLSQSQSMEMFNVNYQTANNEILMRSSPSLYDQRTAMNSSSPIAAAQPTTPHHLRMKPSPHPYVNLLHQQYAASSSPQQNQQVIN
jgi:hypothetical protein